MNFLGVATRLDVGIQEAIQPAGHVRPSLPRDSELAFEWAEILEAVLAARDRFVVIELGAGWGRVLVDAAFAAQARGLDYMCVGVEAEPTHFKWMQRHVRDNGLDPRRVRLMRAAAARQAGWARFYSGDPDSWYGQALDPNNSAIVSRVPIAGLVQDAMSLLRSRRSRGLRFVKTVSLSGVLPPTVVDLLHLDVQGVEADVLESHREILNERVRRVFVATHSGENEARLRRLFGDLGWCKRCDVPLGSDLATDVCAAHFTDGVQVWLNRSL
jgi:FkbM family methyltransferase